MPETQNMSQIEISDKWLEDYKKTAIKWRKEFLELPIAAAQDVLQYMQGITGLCGKMRFPSIESDSQFGPYDPDRVTKALVNIDYRELETHMGSVIEKFHPNDYKLLTMGYSQPTKGDGQKRASATLLVLSQLAKARGKHLAYAVFNGKRNPEGTTTNDLFDGFHTIAEAEIAAGNISAAKGNLYVLSEAVTKLNAVDIAKDIVFGLNPYLRRTPAFLLCSQDFADKYNEAYLETHQSLQYNTKYNQPVIEGSNGNVTIVPLAELDGTDKFYLTPKSNLLWGTDNVSDQSTVVVDRFESFRLTFSSTIFFGVQFHTLDPRRLKVIKIPKLPVAVPTEPKPQPIAPEPTPAG